ncbi:MAG: O-antigen ligase family protein [Cyclobacteriaceae bacterium]|nr:O-antigen ligase family protein [Cyclobacteriaceae bacterium]
MIGSISRPKQTLLMHLIVACAFLIPLSEFLSVRVLLATVLVALVVKRTKGSFDRFMTSGWDALLYVFILMAGLIHTDNLTVGWKEIETSLSLLAVPFLISGIAPFRKEHLYRILTGFTLGLVLSSLICLIDSWVSFTHTANVEVFFFDGLTRVIGLHPTYFAYYVIASITFGLYLLHYERDHYPSGVVIAVVIFLFFILMLTGGTSALVSILFVLAFFVLKFLLDDRSARKPLLLMLVMALILFMFAFNEWSRGGPAERTDAWERLVLWESALVANPDPIFGVGTGDYKSVLNEYYLSHGMIQFADSNFNTHNQYIATYFANGLLGLVCLIVLLGRPLYLATKNGNALGTIIFFPFLIFGITEVFLGRYQGVVFFILLHQAFTAYIQSNKHSFSLKGV